MAIPFGKLWRFHSVNCGGITFFLPIYPEKVGKYLRIPKICCTFARNLEKSQKSKVASRKVYALRRKGHITSPNGRISSVRYKQSDRLWNEHLRYDIDQYLHSMGQKMVDKPTLAQELTRKWSIKPSLADKLTDMMVWMADKEVITTEQVVDSLGYTETTAKRYLRQLTQYGYLEQCGANRNRSYRPKK